MKRAALYGAPQAGAEWQKCYSALSAALTTRFGKGRVHERSTKFYSDEDVCEDVAVAVVLGLRGAGDLYLARNIALGIPTLVVDLGWMRRERNYWQVCPYGLNNAPKKAPSANRFEALNLVVKPPIEKDHRSILVIGQQPGDKQHDLDTETAMLNWANITVREAAEITKKRVFWRPHPGWQVRLPRPAISSSPKRGIHELIREEGVYAAAVYNSTIGLDLLRLGCNVVALGPRTVYTDLVYNKVADLNSSHPGEEKVRDLLCNIAYGQYTTTELNNWASLEHVLELHQITGDW